MKRILTILSMLSLGLGTAASLQAQDYGDVHDDCYYQVDKLNADELRICVTQLTNALTMKQQNFIDISNLNLSDPKMVPLSDPKMDPAESDPKMLPGSDPKMIDDYSLSDPKMIYK